MARNDVDINLVATQDKKTSSNLDAVLKKLKEIDKLSKFKLVSSDSSNMKKVTSETKKQSEYERLRKKYAENLKKVEAEILAMKNLVPPGVVPSADKLPPFFTDCESTISHFFVFGLFPTTLLQIFM